MKEKPHLWNTLSTYGSILADLKLFPNHFEILTFELGGTDRR